MIFPRREEATNQELILTIIQIQGFLERYGPSHNNWHETLNEVQARLEQKEQERLIDPAYEKTLNKWIGAEVLDRIRNEMHATAEKHEDGVYYLRDEWVDEIIDKYAEGSDKE